MQKRICLGFVLTCLCVMAVFGPGKSVCAAEKMRINYWILMAGSDKEVMDLMVAEFNKTHPDVEVYSWVTSFDNYYQQLTAAMAAGQGPDVATMHTRNIPSYASDKLMYPIDEIVAKYGLKNTDFIEAAWQGGVVNGKRWAIPIDVIIAMVEFYNKDLFAKAGITTIAQTGEELLAQARKLKEATGAWGFEVPLTGIRLYRYWYSAFSQLGGQLLTPDFKKAAFNTPDGVKALQFWVDFIHKEKLAPDAAMGNEGEGFRFGKLACTLDGVWISNGLNATQGLNWDIGSMPSIFNNGNRAFFSNSHNWAFPKSKGTSPEKFQKAFEFALWMSEHSLPWGEKARMLPARKAVIDSPEYKALPWSAALLAQSKDASYPPQIKQTGQMQDILIKYLEMAIVAKITPAEALQTAEAEVNKILQ
jgi:multiple sugar transport system substrate-binding protein